MKNKGKFLLVGAFCVAMAVSNVEQANEEKNNNFLIQETPIHEAIVDNGFYLIKKDNNSKEGVKISFTAVNSPLGGYEQATPAMYTPFFRQISKFFNIAIASDISPNSEFYNNLEKKFESGSIEAKIIESLEDNIAQPSGSISKERYENIAKSFNNRLVVSGDHEYAKEPKNLQKHGVYLVGSLGENIQEMLATMRKQGQEKKTELRM